MLNVGPTHNGLIQPLFVERLRSMGSWLKINGEAIYGSKPWIHQNDSEAKNIWYTSKSQSNGRIVVYAIVLYYPYDVANVNLISLAGKTDKQTTVKMLGYPSDLEVSSASLLPCRHRMQSM